MLSLSLVASNGCPPALVLYQDQGFSKDIQPLLSMTRSRREIMKPTGLFLTPYKHDDLFKSATEFYEYGKFAKSTLMTRLPHQVPFSSSIDEWLTTYQQMLQVLSRLNVLKEDSLEHSLLLELIGLRAKTTDVHLHNIATADFELNRFLVEKASLLQDIDNDLMNDLSSKISFPPDVLLCLHGNAADMMDQASVFAEFGLTMDAILWRQQKMLVPHFKWNDTVELQGHVCPSSLELEADITAPHKSCQKAKPKKSTMRKSKKLARERDLHKNNSLHACETLLSIMMHKKRNGKSVLSSLKKFGPELPQLLTQVSASIAGTGLAIIFSVLYKLASGSAAVCTSSVLTSGFGVALFWLSWAVNKLRSTIIYIGKNSAKLSLKEEESVRRLDKCVKEISFRAAASMAILILRFA